jgi:hypothetical protein
MSNKLVIREWDCDRFHRRVLELEAQGYIALLDSYTVTPEMNPDTGVIIHLYSIEMQEPVSVKLVAGASWPKMKP